MSSRFSLLQYLLGLPPDGLEPLIVQAAQAKGLNEFPFPPAWIYPSNKAIRAEGSYNQRLLI
ncbi:hypothetical protein FOQG_17406 [Fusarium oxysporum f. sp. raphani 54005]|uniref:Uncharacterized protein n=1 Tax=Fusarium oxysporum f. sp. raphani 54005 TaxID=1089458 RepID=X0B801_FUSOX|nr:hypothetical protein FOQG_17406 [Fusarium oxysporum f. sp. raphani 54005]